MPQLNPTPWFMVFILIWVFLIMFFTKTLNNNPPLSTSQYYKQPSNHHWIWPWL
ncbi:ATP synthase F0 subunit 8 (mitochondrion) [Lacerta agilis]|uniref:ATP synthase complex subunit 8 n=1 Tax=Lacerta agilis TaxID=80427 RepID=S5FKV8_LACAG|nr:ATP synthase F0 subunit 8 [Lacerta agilis]AGQ46007.1 ATP synthase F0 subunit 8 [Lacerta agilis]